LRKIDNVQVELMVGKNVYEVFAMAERNRITAKKDLLREISITRNFSIFGNHFQKNGKGTINQAIK
jgi:hypothetical protein